MLISRFIFLYTYMGFFVDYSTKGRRRDAIIKMKYDETRNRLVTKKCKMTTMQLRTYYLKDRSNRNTKKN